MAANLKSMITVPSLFDQDILRTCSLLRLVEVHVQAADARCLQDFAISQEDRKDRSSPSLLQMEPAFDERSTGAL